MAHTKGAWKTKDISKNEIIISIENYGDKDANYRKDNGCGHIATIKGWTGYSVGTLSDEDKANANLIAAAPQLYNAAYKALQAIYAMPKSKQGFYQYLIDELLNAIQKADGTII